MDVANIKKGGDLSMESNWLEELFRKQERLDSYIVEVKGISGTFESKFNAYMVELGEFLNEVKAFKYWSNSVMCRDSAFEEFVDGVHFLLSLGNMKWGVRDVSNLQRRVEEQEKDFLNKYVDGDMDDMGFVRASNVMYTSCKKLVGNAEDYEDYFVSFIRLGMLIGMDISKIVDEYIKKNEENYRRQDNGY